MISGARFLIRAICKLGVQAGVNVRHYSVSSHTGSGCTDQEVVDAYAALLGPRYKAWLATDASYAGTELQVYVPQLNIAVGSTAAGGSGSVVAPTAPRQVSGLISWKTALGGRKNRGRTYVPFVPTAGISPPDKVTASQQTLLETIGTTWGLARTVTGASGSITVVHVIEHRPLGSGFTPVTVQVTHADLATQRRRSPYGRPDFPS